MRPYASSFLKRTFKHSLSTLLCLGTAALAQAATFTSRASGNWNAPTTWTIGDGTDADGIPDGDDKVTIVDGHNVTVNLTDAFCLSLIVGPTQSFTSTLTFTANSQLTVNGAVTVASNGQRKGKIDMSAGGKLIANSISASNNNDPADPNALFTPGTGTVELRATNTLPDVSTFAVYNNLILNGGTTTASRALDINGNLTISSGTFVAGAFTHTVAGNWTRTGTFTPSTGTINFDGAGTQTINASNFNNVIKSGAGLTLAGGNFTISGDLSVTGGVLDLGSSTANRTAAGGTLSLGANTTLRIGGTTTFPANYTQNTLDIASTVVYGGQAQSVRALTYGNLILQGSAGALKSIAGATTIAGDFTITGASTMATATAALTVNGAFNLAAGVTLNAGSANHLIKGQWNNNIGTGTAGAAFNAQTGTFTFNSAAGMQTIGGNTPTTFNNIIFNNPAGITLGQPSIVGGLATFTSGLVASTVTNVLSFNGTATVTGASNASHVNGPVQKTGTAAFTFPVGRGSKYVPVGIGTATASNTFLAEYVPSSGAALGPIGAGARTKGLEAVSTCEYWTLNRTAGSSPVDVTLTWGTDNACSGAGYIKDPFFLVVAHFNGTNWDAFSERPNNVVVTGDTTAGTVTWKSVSTFSPFTLGSTNVAQAPLPVTFVSFNGRKVGTGIQLTWKVAGETNVTGYEVERKVAGGPFLKIGGVAATGSSSYTFTDATPQKGTVLYRVKNVDGDGKFAYSNVFSFRTDASASVFTATPTLVSNKTYVQHDAATNRSVLTLSTTSGMLLRRIQLITGAQATSVDMSGLQPGLYLLQYHTGLGMTQTIKLVKQ